MSICSVEREIEENQEKEIVIKKKTVEKMSLKKGLKDNRNFIIRNFALVKKFAFFGQWLNYQ